MNTSIEMSNRELLEWAAKACGYTIYENGKDINGNTWYWCEQIADVWGPLTDDGDALRLAVKLNLAVTPYPIYELPKHSAMVRIIQMPMMRRERDVEIETIEPYSNDQCAATRRAIVRAAAEIGKKVGLPYHSLIELDTKEQ